MRKLLSVLLAVLIVASVTVVSFSAAETGTATVTLKSVKGNTVTKTYAVGETFTTYTYLNASQINSGKIGSLDGTQYYSNSVLELAEDYDPVEGDIFDVETVFPVTKTATVASGHWTESEEKPGMGAVYFNATIASYSGFKFDADDKALIICKYKVKAAGTATVENAFTTLACSDFDLTRIVNQGVIVNNNFTSPVALSEPATPVVTGYTVSGVATSYKTNDGVDDVTLKLTGSDNNYTDTVTVTATYSGVAAATEYAFANVPAGEYTLSVEKGNHVTREYTVSVSADTTQDVKICPIGDVNMNGRVQSNDATKAYKHVQGGAEDQLTDYAFKCADVNKNGRIQSNDATQIYRQTTGAHNLF